MAVPRRTAVHCQICLTDPSHVTFHNLARINAEINIMPRNDLVEMLKSLHIDSEGSVDVLKKRLKSYHKRHVIHKTGKQAKCDYICVIDFEATCEEEVEDYPHEIIEFPAVLIDMNSHSIVDEFQSYCKPVINPVLSNFCKNLTGISQNDVDDAEEFPEVLKRFETWLDKHQLRTKYSFAIATDGPCDMSRFLRNQCEASNVPFPTYAEQWINIRKIYSNFYKTRRMNIASMLDFIGLSFQGSQHCGLHDSRNIARIILKMISDGAYLKCNDRLSDKPVSNSTSSKKTRTRKADRTDDILDVSKCNPNDYLGVDPETLGCENLLLAHK